MAASLAPKKQIMTGSLVESASSVSSGAGAKLPGADYPFIKSPLTVVAVPGG